MPMVEVSSGYEHDKAIVYASDDELMKMLVCCGDEQLARIDQMLHDAFADDQMPVQS